MPTTLSFTHTLPPQLTHYFSGDLGTLSLGIPYHTCNATTVARETTVFFVCFFFQNLTSHWILTSQHWTTDKKAEKRPRQLDFLLNNMDNKSHIWFYFALHCEEWLFLNGQKRSTNN